MKQVHLFPPNYRRINDVFNVRGKPVIFTYGDTIYNPSRIKVTPELKAHEAVHAMRQGTDPETWWDRYLVSPEFRLNEELPAHEAEAREASNRYGGKALDAALHQIATRLSSPLYGCLISYREAMENMAAAAAWPMPNAM